MRIFFRLDICVMSFLAFQIFTRSTQFIAYERSTVYIIGTASGIATYLPAIQGNAYMISSLFKEYSIWIYCPKTDIDTLQSSWMLNDTRVHVIEELEYGPGFEQKPARLAFGRNKLLNEIQRQIQIDTESLDAAFMVVMDMDEVIGHVFNLTVIRDAMDRNAEWDAVSFNNKRYYDIWALRYNKFDSNVWGFKKPDAYQLVKIIKNDISKLLSVNDGIQFFPVYSAFNGVAIYKLKVTEGCQYDGENREPFVDSPWGDCEHVAFHRCMRKKHNAKIVIDKSILDTDESWLDSSKAVQSGNIIMRAFRIFAADCSREYVLVLNAVFFVVLVLFFWKRRACSKNTAFRIGRRCLGVVAKDTVSDAVSTAV